MKESRLLGIIIIIIITSIHFTLRVRWFIAVVYLLIVYRFSLALSKLVSILIIVFQFEPTT